ncbi:ankyrin repeat-containing protein [Talaromyces pinophilus]|uniref:Ankyrin repeat-containing protein n=1 Tax=Talaromyces pinophilus TaxID=128442 RepID=A0A478ECM7_TALPI|nr:ankyrin repeat-containing protein [Talaromyces pinophilus]
MILDQLPTELLRLIAHFLDKEIYINTLCRANSRLYHALNPFLYRYNCQRSNSAALLWAAKAGSEATTRFSIREGANLDLSEDGRTLLTLAAQGGHTAVVVLLLETGKFFIDSKDTYGRTALSQAASYGHERLLKWLLHTGKVNVNSKDDYGQTPLFHAAAGGHEAIVKFLIMDETSNFDIKDCFYDQTPLSVATANGHESTVKLLLETGKVDVNSKCNNGSTPLSIAAAKGDEALVKLLLQTEKVDVDTKDHRKVDANSKDNDGHTPLCVAAIEGHEAVVKLLLETGKVDVNARDVIDRTPLFWAICRKHEAIVKLLLGTRDVDVNLTDNEGVAPLSQAIKNHQKTLVKLLLATENVDVNSRDCVFGNTPFSYALTPALSQRDEEYMKLLLETGKVDVNCKDNDGYTPLSIAALLGDVKLIELDDDRRNTLSLLAGDEIVEGVPEWFQRIYEWNLESWPYDSEVDCLPFETSWSCYTQLLRGQEDILNSGADLKALKYGLKRFPALHRITISPAAHGLLGLPLYQTPMIRAFPPGLNYCILPAWPLQFNPLDEEELYEAPSWDQEEAKEWRGFSMILRELAEMSGHTSRSSSSMPIGVLKTGLNCRVFD